MKKKLKQPIFDSPARYVEYQTMQIDNMNVMVSKYDTMTIIRGYDFRAGDRGFEVPKRGDAFTYDPYPEVGFRIVRNR